MIVLPPARAAKARLVVLFFRPWVQSSGHSGTRARWASSGRGRRRRVQPGGCLWPRARAPRRHSSARSSESARAGPRRVRRGAGAAGSRRSGGLGHPGRWMRILSRVFLDRFPNRVVNLHPALPGQFPGTDAIERAFSAFRRGEIKHTGVMVHLVPDEGVDSGPVLAQEVVPIRMDDTLETLEARVHSVEHRLLVQVIRDLIKRPPDKVSHHERRTV